MKPLARHAALALFLAASFAWLYRASGAAGTAPEVASATVPAAAEAVAVDRTVELTPAAESGESTRRASDRTVDTDEPESGWSMAVLDASGSALGGLQLRAEWSRDLGETESADGRMLVATDERGRLVIPWADLDRVPTEIQLGEVQGQRSASFYTSALQRGHVVELDPVFLLAPKERGLVRLATGLVVSDRGTTISEPDLRLRSWKRAGNSLDASDQSGDRFDIHSRPDGTFTIYGPDSVTQLALEIRAPGHRRKSVRVAPEDAWTEVRLEAEQLVTGRLEVPAGGPAPPEYALWIQQAGRSRSVRPGADGRFEFMVSASDLTVGVFYPEFGIELLSVAEALRPGDPSPDLLLDLVPAVAVRELLVVGPDGMPLANRELRVDCPECSTGHLGTMSRPSVRTNAAGEALFVQPVSVDRVQLKLPSLDLSATVELAGNSSSMRVQLRAAPEHNRGTAD